MNLDRPVIYAMTLALVATCLGASPALVQNETAATAAVETTATISNPAETTPTQALEAAAAPPPSEGVTTETAAQAEQTSPSAAGEAEGTSVTLPSGVAYKNLKVGTGDKLTTDMEVRIHYTLRVKDKIMDDSRTRPIPVPLRFKYGGEQTIPGLQYGMEGMRVGGRRLVTVPPALGYGAKGSGSIPANSTLNFDLELLGMKPAPPPAEGEPAS